MRTQPLVQTAIFDVADWESDPEFGVFPQGARAKDAVFAPLRPPEPVLVPGKRICSNVPSEVIPISFGVKLSLTG